MDKTQNTIDSAHHSIELSQNTIDLSRHTPMRSQSTMDLRRHTPLFSPKWLLASLTSLAMRFKRIAKRVKTMTDSLKRFAKGAK